MTAKIRDGRPPPAFAADARFYGSAIVTEQQFKDGSWDLRSIISISPLREVDALRAFKKLRERGIIDLVEAQAKTA